MPTPNPQTEEDPFDTLVSLEDALYNTAYNLGIADGAFSGRIEGRIFGLEKGFEKFSAMGSLFGRSVVWGSRLQQQPSKPSTSSSQQNDEQREMRLPILETSNPRLQTHTSHLHGLSDPATFSTLNTEEAVNDFDSRFKRAGAKVKIIERMIGESSHSHSQEQEEVEVEIDVNELESAERDGNEDGGVMKVGAKARMVKGRKKGGTGGGGGGGGDGQMEDFKLRGLEI